MLIFLLTHLFADVLATINVVEKGIVPLEKGSVGMQFFMDVENDNRNGDCVVHCWTKKCCLTAPESPDSDEDCGVMHVYSPYTNIVKPKDRVTLINVYPILVQHDLVGFCDFTLNYNCDSNKYYRREVVNIPFDTRISESEHIADLLQNYVEDADKVECNSLDEDSLNQCAPINCANKYLEILSYFDPNQRKCVRTTECISSPAKELPDVAYIRISNKCRDLDTPLRLEDVILISKRMTVVTEEPAAHLTKLKVEMKSNCSTISENICLLRDLVLGKLTPILNVDMTDYKKCLIRSLLQILIGMVIICVALLFFIFVVFVVSCIHNKRQRQTLYKTYTAFTQKLKREPTSTLDPRSDLKISHVNTKVRNSLLKDVIVRDIPMELRDSVVDICERMEKDVKWKKRYRKQDLGSQLSLHKSLDPSTSDTSTDGEAERSSLLRKPNT